MTPHLLAAIANPDVALILLLLGILLLYAEFNRPGTIVLAAAGTLLLTLGLYGFSRHSIHPGALGWVAFGLSGVLIAIRSQGRLLSSVAAVSGTALLAVGLFTLFPGTPQIHLTTAVLASLIFSTVTLWLGRIALQARRNKRSPIKAAEKEAAEKSLSA